MGSFDLLHAFFLNVLLGNCSALRWNSDRSAGIKPGGRDLKKCIPLIVEAFLLKLVGFLDRVYSGRTIEFIIHILSSIPPLTN